MTTSPSLRPSVTIHLSPCTLPVLIDRGATLPSAPTVITDEPLLSRWTACCGTVMAESLTACSSRARTYMPGSRKRSGLGNSARSVTAPELWSTARSENSSLPVCG